jgi:signal transduction histidine kinase
MKSGAGRTDALPLPARGGKERSIAWTARAVEGKNDTAIVLVGHDLTELEEAQRQALQAERLAAIGSTAAGLAHEARNALQRSQSCLSLLALRLKDNAEAMDLIGRIQSAQDDLHRLYEDVREYAAPLRLDRVPCDLCEVWRQAWDDVSYRPGFRGAVLHEEECGVPLKCVADPFHLKRVFRNIFDNSLAAGTDPLQIRVHCSEVWLGQRSAVRVSLRDNGPGFPEGHSDELFEPFYTTKPRGTGLGLSICRRIVEAHGGTIEADAGPGPGAEIIITLPRRTP